MTSWDCLVCGKDAGADWGFYFQAVIKVSVKKNLYLADSTIHVCDACVKKLGINKRVMHRKFREFLKSLWEEKWN